jgi:hypothetical protein
MRSFLITILFFVSANRANCKPLDAGSQLSTEANEADVLDLKEPNLAPIISAFLSVKSTCNSIGSLFPDELRLNRTSYIMKLDSYVRLVNLIFPDDSGELTTKQVRKLLNEAGSDCGVVLDAQRRRRREARIETTSNIHLSPDQQEASKEGRLVLFYVDKEDLGVALTGGEEFVHLQPGNDEVRQRRLAGHLVGLGVSLLVDAAIKAASARNEPEPVHIPTPKVEVNVFVVNNVEEQSSLKDYLLQFV